MRIGAKSYESTKGRMLKLLIVGAEPRNLPPDLSEICDVNHITRDASTFPPSLVGYDAVIPITRWIGPPQWAEARAGAQKAGIPLLPVQTGNYILPRLVEAKFLVRKGNEAPPANASQMPPPVAAPSDDMSSVGISIDELWNAYWMQLRDAFKALGEPGEILDKEASFDLICESVGIDRKQLQELLPKCHLSRYFRYEGDTKIQILGLGYKYEPKAAQPEEKSPREKLIELLPSLPVREFPGRYGLAKILACFKEFWNEDGPKSLEAYRRLVLMAIERGVLIEGEDGTLKLKYFTEHQLQPVKPLPAHGRDYRKKPTNGEAAAPTVLESAFELRQALGRVPSLDSRTDGMKAFEKLIPGGEFDRFAAKAILAKLGLSPENGNLDKMLDHYQAFSEHEWSYFAWETMKSFTVQQMALLLRKPRPEDAQEFEARQAVAGEEKV